MDIGEKLYAIEQIKQLKARYFRFIDTKDWDGLVTIFCRDAIFDASQSGADPNRKPWQGRDGIVTAIRTAVDGAVTVHHGHGHEIEIDSPNEAHGLIAMDDILRWAPPRDIAVHGYGHYHEQYRFEDGAWRIWRSKLTRLLVDRAAGKG